MDVATQNRSFGRDGVSPYNDPSSELSSELLPELSSQLSEGQTNSSETNTYTIAEQREREEQGLGDGYEGAVLPTLAAIASKTELLGNAVNGIESVVTAVVDTAFDLSNESIPFPGVLNTMNKMAS